LRAESKRPSASAQTRITATDGKKYKMFHDSGGSPSVKLIQVLLMLALWSSPIVYAWTMVGDLVARAHMPGWVLEVYTSSPLTLAVLGFHRAFWSGFERA
jgi:hypothetical protein